jgi:hypothetical protein
MDIIAKPKYLRLVEQKRKFDTKEKVFLQLIEQTLISQLEQNRTIHNAWASGDKSKVGLKEYNDQVQNLLLLGTHPDMIEIWCKILSWTDEQDLEDVEDAEDAEDEEDVEDRSYFIKKNIEEIIVSITQALNYKNNWEDLKLSERKPTYENIIKKMETLANELKHYDLDQKDYVSYDTSANHCFVFYDQTYSDSNTPSASATFREIYENRSGIQISDMLLDHAASLKEQERYRYALYKNSKSSKEPRLRKFANYMAVENEKNFGAIHESIISILASAFFPKENTSLEDIRSMIRPVREQIKKHVKKHLN